MTKIQLAYPKIPDRKNCPNEQCIAFEKYDGTNLHWVWEIELGWYAFGTRRSRFDFDEMGIAEFNAAHPGLEEAPDIFMRDFASPLESIFRENEQYHCAEITVFAEFFGANSFAGMHKQGDRKQLVLFDVETDRGMVVPDRFIQDFAKLNIARAIYRGKLNGKFMDDVRSGKYSVNEGVVCKGEGNVNNRWMVKIKTDAYMQRLREAFQDDWEHYWE
ncbi:RNA ligase family protein [Microcoleus sp. herbarium14]|uniref:RNA ligase family protein n=1 Tax=Microcoleus sp. herbarium14 TaxID=3055439 RepID=UPI002FCEC3AC